MKQVFQFGILSVMGFIVMTSMTGCASGKNQRQLNAMQSQIGVLTDEVVRLDQDLQDVRGSMQGGSRGGTFAPSGGGAGLGPVYRTPSGFELPAKSIQEALKNAGYYSGPIDGKIGSGTKSAIEAFQRDHSLNADGVVGRQTWDKLKVYQAGGVK